MAILALDYGLKKIGLAVGEGNLVAPLGVAENNSRIFEKLGLICQERNISKIIIGLPQGELVSAVRDFGRRISEKFDLPVIYKDETLTTKDAVDMMVACGKKREYRKRQEDAFAAALILESYFEEKNV